MKKEAQIKKSNRPDSFKPKAEKITEKYSLDKELPAITEKNSDSEF